MVTAVFAHLEIVVEFAFEQVGLAAVAFDEDVFRLHHAFFRWHRLYSLVFLTEPVHKNGGKGSTNIANFRLPIADFRDLCGSSIANWQLGIGNVKTLFLVAHGFRR
jgi:hypothetical protein